jgi:hypothetical protein
MTERLFFQDCFCEFESFVWTHLFKVYRKVYPGLKRGEKYVDNTDVPSIDQVKALKPYWK